MRSRVPGPPPSPFCSLLSFFYISLFFFFFLLFFFCLTPCIVNRARVLACKAKKGSEAFLSDTFQCRPLGGGLARAGEEE